MEILKKVLDFSDKYNMLRPGDTVLVCVSGGADSMCLLHMLHSLAQGMGFTVCAAHFNHNLRGAESDGDQKFVEDYCKRLSVPLHIGSDDVTAKAALWGKGIEETARELRYEFFFKTASALGDAKIATAHNADDNLETILLRIARGTGLLGLGGIPPERGNIIRPLLQISRSEIDAYLSENDIPHREDSSNASDDYSRNRIRHQVIPVLRSVNPECAAAAGNMAELLREDERFLTSLASDLINEHYRDGRISTAILLSTDRAISSRAVRLICGEGLSASHVQSILELARSDDPSAELSLPGMVIHREYGDLVFGDNTAPTFPPRVLMPDSELFIEEINASFLCENTVLTGGIHKSLTSFLFKREKVCGNITIRSKKPGDRIALHPNSGSKSLKKLFIEKKIPARLRESVPVITDDNGPLAVPGIGCDIRVRPRIGDNVLKVTFREIKNND